MKRYIRWKKVMIRMLVLVIVVTPFAERVLAEDVDTVWAADEPVLNYHVKFLLDSDKLLNSRKRLKKVYRKLFHVEDSSTQKVDIISEI